MSENECFQFTLAELKQRIVEWASHWRANHPLRHSLDILLYQDLFMMTHTLQGSFQWIVDLQGPDAKQLKALSLPLQQSDESLRHLALGETDFVEPEIAAALYDLACKPFSIEQLHSLVFKKPLRDLPLPEMKTLPVCSDQAVSIHWDAFSRARLVSAQRANFQFWQKSEGMALAELPSCEHRVQAELKNLHGALIAKTVRPKSSSDGGALHIDCLFLVAAPGPKVLPTPWQKAF